MRPGSRGFTPLPRTVKTERRGGAGRPAPCHAVSANILFLSRRLRGPRGPPTRHCSDRPARPAGRRAAHGCPWRPTACARHATQCAACAAVRTRIVRPPQAAPDLRCLYCGFYLKCELPISCLPYGARPTTTRLSACELDGRVGARTVGNRERSARGCTAGRPTLHSAGACWPWARDQATCGSDPPRLVLVSKWFRLRYASVAGKNSKNRENRENWKSCKNRKN